MGLPATPILRTIYHYSDESNNSMSTTAYWEPDTLYLTSTNMVTVANDAFDQGIAVLAHVMPIICFISHCHVLYTSGGPGGDFFEGVSTHAAAPGTIATQDTLPPEAALIIRRRTGQQGRDKRGRMFIGCIAEGIQTDGVIDVANVAAARAVAGFFGADRTFGGIVNHARHWDRKTNTMIAISACVAMRHLGTRRDRNRRNMRTTLPA